MAKFFDFDAADVLKTVQRAARRGGIDPDSDIGRAVKLLAIKIDHEYVPFLRGMDAIYKRRRGQAEIQQRLAETIKAAAAASFGLHGIAAGNIDNEVIAKTFDQIFALEGNMTYLFETGMSDILLRQRMEAVQASTGVDPHNLREALNTFRQYAAKAAPPPIGRRAAAGAFRLAGAAGRGLGPAGATGLKAAALGALGPFAGFGIAAGAGLRGLFKRMRGGGAPPDGQPPAPAGGLGSPFGGAMQPISAMAGGMGATVPTDSPARKMFARLPGGMHPGVGILVQFYSRYAHRTRYLRDLLKATKKGATAAAAGGGSLSSLLGIGVAGGAARGLLGNIARLLPILAPVAGVGIGAFQAWQAQSKGQEWLGTDQPNIKQRIALGVGGFFGGTSPGIGEGGTWSALLAGLGVGALKGFLIGAPFGPVGMVVGAVLGLVFAAIGGKRITQATDWLIDQSFKGWVWISDKVSIAWEWWGKQFEVVKEWAFKTTMRLITWFSDVHDNTVIFWADALISIGDWLSMWKDEMIGGFKVAWGLLVQLPVDVVTWFATGSPAAKKRIEENLALVFDAFTGFISQAWLLIKGWARDSIKFLKSKLDPRNWFTDEGGDVASAGPAIGLPSEGAAGSATGEAPIAPVQSSTARDFGSRIHAELREMNRREGQARTVAPERIRQPMGYGADPVLDSLNVVSS